MTRFLILFLGVFCLCAPALMAEEEEAPSTTHPDRASIETLKADYNTAMLALTDDFLAGDMTQEEYNNAILAANATLVSDIDAVKAGGMPEDA